MPILKELREAKYLTTYEGLPSPVQKKVCQIEILYDRAILYLEAKKRRTSNVTDFKAHIRDIYEKRIKASQENHEDELSKGNVEPTFYRGLHYEFWIETLANSKYEPLDLFRDGLSFSAMMLAALWIYWMFWPYYRRIFEKENRVPSWYTISTKGTWAPPPAPPSAPTFEAALDRSLVWLAHDVGTETANIEFTGIREGNRTANTKRTQQKNKAERDQLIIKTFYDLQFPKEAFPKGVSLHKVAEMIQTILQKGKEFLHIDTIKRALKKNEEIWKQFKEIKIKGRKYFIKQV